MRFSHRDTRRLYASTSPCRALAIRSRSSTSRKINVCSVRKDAPYKEKVGRGRESSLLIIDVDGWKWFREAYAARIPLKVKQMSSKGGAASLLRCGLPLPRQSLCFGNLLRCHRVRRRLPSGRVRFLILATGGTRGGETQPRMGKHI